MGEAAADAVGAKVTPAVYGKRLAKGGASIGKAADVGGAPVADGLGWQVRRLLELEAKTAARR